MTFLNTYLDLSIARNRDLVPFMEPLRDDMASGSVVAWVMADSVFVAHIHTCFDKLGFACVMFESIWQIVHKRSLYSLKDGAPILDPEVVYSEPTTGSALTPPSGSGGNFSVG